MDAACPLIPDVFLVPREVVARHLSRATEIQLKVLLFALSEGSVDFARLGELLGCEASDVKAAAAYWEGAGILCLAGPQAARRESRPQAPAAASAPRAEEAAEPGPVPPRGETRPNYTPEDVAAALERSAELKTLLNHAQAKLGKLFTPSETAILFSLNQWIGLSPDVILMLIEHCTSEGKNSLRYIEKAALTWADRGIDSYEKAEEYLLSLQKSKTREAAAKKALGLSRELTSKEKDYVTEWMGEMGFSAEMVLAAYEICADRTGKLSMAYMDKILRSWREKGITSPELIALDRKGTPAPEGGEDDYLRRSMEKSRRHTAGS